MIIKKCIAEFMGTFLLCYIGCGASILNNNPLASPLIFTFLIIGLASGFGPISGAHLNPSVSLGFLLIKQLTIKDFCLYIISQILGAFFGFFFLYHLLLSIKGEVKDLACNVYGELSPNHISIKWAFFFEYIITCYFVYIIITNYKKKEAPFIIGCTLGTLCFFGGNLTGGSMNPARSLAPAVIMGGKALYQVWLFILAPLTGTLQAFTLYGIFYKKEDKKNNDKETIKENNK